MRSNKAYELRKHDACKSYVMHGFSPENDNSEEIFGACSFCGRPSSMYVNKKTKKWDCKYCERSGGFQLFIEQMYKHCRENFKGTAAIELSKSRNIAIPTLREFNAGYNRITEKYCIPVFDIENKKLIDLRVYDGRLMMSTYTCKSFILNANSLLQNKNDTVYICEGEWDAIAVKEMCNKLKLNNPVISVPGAGTFKGEWFELFRKRSVIVMYDNDKPGNKGALKVFNSIRTLVKSIQFVRWPKKYKSGYDVRDLYRDNKCKAAITMKQLKSMLHDLPPGTNYEELSNAKQTTEANYDGNGLDAETVRSIYKKYLHLPNTDIIDILYGAVIANRLDGDPLWLFIVAPSGMTKSEFLMSLSEAKGIHTEDSLTVAGLVSGYTAGGIDHSLLPQLDGKVLNVKDFTTLLKSNPNTRDELFGMLRSIYDGVFKKRFGNTVAEYRSKFGIIAGVTPAVEFLLEGESALGERFLRFELPLPNGTNAQLEYIARAFDNVKQDKGIRTDMLNTASECLNYEFNSNVEIPENIREKLLYLALFTSNMRATIIRDRFTKEVMHKPIQELGTRIVKQFAKLLIGICMFRRIDEATEAEYSVIKTLARGCSPSKYEDIINKMYNDGKFATYSVSQIARFMKLPNTTCDMSCNSLYMLDVLCKSRKSGLKTDYKLSKRFINIIEKSEVYK